MKPIQQPRTQSGADKAYLSRENLELIQNLGGTCLHPFRSNSTQGEAGTVWEKNVPLLLDEQGHV
jgi:hypothetical protein